MTERTPQRDALPSRSLDVIAWRNLGLKCRLRPARIDLEIGVGDPLLESRLWILTLDMHQTRQAHAAEPNCSLDGERAERVLAAAVFDLRDVPSHGRDLNRGPVLRTSRLAVRPSRDRSVTVDG